MTLITSRHDPIFDYRSFTDPIHVIGIGGIGSHVAYHLVKLGAGVVNELHVWDRDIVEEHNLANQKYDDGDVGLAKTTAMMRHARRWSGITLTAHYAYLRQNDEHLSGVIFLCVDTMRDRRLIWERFIKNNADIPLFIETRMDASAMTVHAINPTNTNHVEEWERHWYPDSEANDDSGGCGGPLAVGPTASATADLAVWQFIRFAAARQGRKDTLDQRILMTMRPLGLRTEQW